MVDTSMKKPGKKGILNLSGSLTIERVEELREMFQNAITRYKSLEVEFGEVTAVDVTALQLCCAAHKTARQQKKEISFPASLPPLLAQAVHMAGFLRKNGCFLEDRHDCFWIRPLSQS